MTVNVNGTIIENIDLKGAIRVYADNVTIRNVKITTGGYWPILFDGKGGVGFTKGTATIELDEKSAAETVLRYDSNIQVGGKIAAVGQRLLEQVGKMMSKQALEALEREMNARLDAGGPA